MMINPDKSMEGFYSYCSVCGQEIWRWDEDALMDADGTIVCSQACANESCGIRHVNWDDVLNDYSDDW